jgi:ribosomal protein S19
VRNFYVHLIVQFDKKLLQNYHTTVSYGTNSMATTNKRTNKNNKKWQKRFPDKLVIPHIITTFFEFYGTRKFITFLSQEPVIGPYPGTDGENRQHRMPFI